MRDFESINLQLRPLRETSQPRVVVSRSDQYSKRKKTYLRLNHSVIGTLNYFISLYNYLYIDSQGTKQQVRNPPRVLLHATTKYISTIVKLVLGRSSIIDENHRSKKGVQI